MSSMEEDDAPLALSRKLLSLPDATRERCGGCFTLKKALSFREIEALREALAPDDCNAYESALKKLKTYYQGKTLMNWKKQIQKDCADRLTRGYAGDRRL